MSFRQQRVFKVVGRIVRHAQPSHHRLRALVARRRDRDDLVQREWTECKLKRGLGRLGRIATSPRISPKSPPRFDGRCEGCLADSNLTRTIAVRPGVSSAASYPRAQHWRPGQIRSVAFAGGCRADLRGVAPSCSAGITSCAAGLGRSVASKPPRGRALQKGPAARTDRQRIMINGLRSGRRRRILREHNGGQFGSINRTPSGAV